MAGSFRRLERRAPSRPLALAMSTPPLPPQLAAILVTWMPFEQVLGAFLVETSIGLMYVCYDHRPPLSIETHSRPDSLFGLGLHQVYRYCRLYPSDSVFIRLLVRSALCLL